MYVGRAATSFMFIVEVVVVVHNLPLDPTFYRTTNRAQSWRFIYRVEYQEMNTLVASSHDIDFQCIVCYVPTKAIPYYTS